MAIATSRMAAIAALVLIVACYGASAKAPGPVTHKAQAPAVSDCFTALMNTSDCLTYVEDGSSLTKPDKGCCPEVVGLVESNPICLCELLGNPETAGIKIDVNKALKLPSACGVSTPPLSTCSAAGVPVSLPPSSEDSLSPSDKPSEGLASSPSEKATGSSPGNKDNGASSIKASSMLFIFGLATAFLSIFF